MLERGGIVNPQGEATWLIEAATGLTRSEQLSRRPGIDETTERRALDLATRRAAGEPIQYVTERAPFRHLELVVGPGVFIPRPETELVAERAMALLPRDGTLVDVGTGSGAIALSIAQERSDARVLATESSPQALAYARRNAERVGAKVDLFEGDLIEALPAEWRGTLDVCVSNPPYVPADDRIGLPRDVVDHEPHIALFAPEQGLGTIRRLGEEVRRWIRPGGWLVLEVGDRQGAAVHGLLKTWGYREIEVSRDLTGRERIVQGRL